MDPETGNISLFWEVMAGGAAGASQVVSVVLSILAKLAILSCRGYLSL
jgi:hypothetical protein